jgi:site-specific DNA recombinase
VSGYCRQKYISGLDYSGPPVEGTKAGGGRPFSKGHLYRILGNPVYIGKIVHKKAVFDGEHPAIIDAELWKAVQKQVSDNLRGRRTRARAVNPSLLAGLVFSAHGDRLTPCQTNKKGKYYPYYVAHSLHVHGREAVPDGLRWPGHELEKAVLDNLCWFLMDEPRQMDLMGAVGANEAQNRLQFANGIARGLGTPRFATRREGLQQIVGRITVHTDKIQITVRTEAIWPESTGGGNDKQTAVIEVPVLLKRSGMSVRLIVRAPGESEPRIPDPKLAALIAKSHDWFARLASGRSDSLLAFSKEERVTSAYVARVINLAFLAPDIVERFVRGDNPKDLNSDRFVRMGPFPVDWQEQRLLLGLAD